MKKILLSLTVSAAAFAAGYVLPNGTILYDGSTDGTLYKIEKVSVMPNQHNVEKITQPPSQNYIVEPNAQTVVQAAQASQTYYPVQTTSVVIEDRTVVYEKPVYIRERIYRTNPVYDIVDLTGTILVYGLLYDSIRRGFFHHELHRDRPYNYYKHDGKYDGKPRR